ncbi:MAG: hypothetical protein H0U74_09775 [Bradymonadaceae bacterium]|nr:hypothetical protein [Lujinxingiaceae bacterium]
MHRLQDLVRLHRMGVPTRKIAKLLTMGPNTERRYREALKSAELLDGALDELPSLELLIGAVEEHLPEKIPPQQSSSVEPWRQTIETMFKRGAGPQAIYDALRLEHVDFGASLSAIKRFCLQLKEQKGPAPEDVVIRVETVAGDVAQIDFGSVGKLYDPESKLMREAHLFSMVLGHSRLMYVDIVFD